MNDIGLFLVNNCFDLVIEKQDLKADDGLETVVSISLFSDQRVREEELIFGQERKRGWWGDAISEIDKDQIGSKMWLLERGKRTLEDLTKLQEYAKLSLKWMLEDGIASAIQVAGEFDVSEQTILNITIQRPNDVESRYSVLWDAQEVRRI